VLRHYDRLANFPAGFVVLGDAIASFNPLYGQDKSVAALEAQALQQILVERAAQMHSLARLAQSFFPKAADIAANAWILAANVDLVSADPR
jgi:hypothetical protein